MNSVNSVSKGSNFSSSPTSAEGPTDQLDQDGYLPIRSSVLGGRLVLVVLDPARVPEDLRHVPRFDLAEVDRLLALPREDAREVLRALLRVRETIGPTSLVDVRPAPVPAGEPLPAAEGDAPAACPTCHGTDLRRGRAAALVCGRCHPPVDGPEVRP